jgi:hypothetical protein
MNKYKGKKNKIPESMTNTYVKEKRNKCFSLENFFNAMKLFFKTLIFYIKISKELFFI